MSERADSDNQFPFGLSEGDASILAKSLFPDGAVYQHSARSHRLASLLELLDLPCGEEMLLGTSRTGRIETVLLTVEHTMVPSVDEKLRALLDACEDADSLAMSRQERIECVLRAIEEQEQRGQEHFRLAPPDRQDFRGRRRIRMGDLVSLAAVILIGAATLFPSMFAVHGSAEKIQCAQNMQRAGLGFSLFAKDHDGHIPAVNRIEGVSPGRTVQWWLVGDPNQSHSANLFVLVREDYLPLEALACPGNRRAPVNATHQHSEDWRQSDEVSYSYQLFAGPPPRFSDRSLSILLADRSPIISRAMQGQVVDATVNSRNHRGRGQSLLLPDGSVVFVPTPELSNGDNIWLPRPLEGSPKRVTMSGAERPDGHRDAFVGP